MNLTKKQTEEVLSNYLSEKNGLNGVLEMMLNAMMLCEREEYLRQDAVNKGNGYRLGSVFGFGSQIELRIPRDRQSRFLPTILALFRDQESYLKEVSFSLYSKGLTTRDISDVIQKIYGSHYSKSSISNISQSFYEQMSAWRNRTIDKHYIALYIDGIIVKLRRDSCYQNECFYIILGLKEDYSREIISIVNQPTESAEGWREVFSGLKQRGLRSAGLIISDGLAGLESSIAKEFNGTAHQKCTVHLERKLLSYVRREDKKALAEDFKKVLSPDKESHSKEMAHQELLTMANQWGVKYKALQRYIEKLEWQPYFTYLDYDTRIRRMIYTTNWIERFNKSARRTLKIRGAFPNEESVLALITSVAQEKTDNHYKHPIYSFKFEPKLANENGN